MDIINKISGFGEILPAQDRDAISTLIAVSGNSLDAINSTADGRPIWTLTYTGDDGMIWGALTYIQSFHLKSTKSEICLNIGSLAVFKEHRGIGVGTKLLAAMDQVLLNELKDFNDAAGNNMRNGYILLRTDKNDLHPYYESRGFEPRGGKGFFKQFERAHHKAKPDYPRLPKERYRPHHSSGMMADKEKIQSICDQTGCTLEQARQYLIAAGGDAVNAILLASN